MSDLALLSHLGSKLVLPTLNREHKFPSGQPECMPIQDDVMNPAVVPPTCCGCSCIIIHLKYKL